MPPFTLLASSGISLPPDSYIYQILPLTAQTSPTTFVPLANGSRLAALSSNNSLTVLDAASLKVASTLENVSSSVTCMTRFAPAQQDCNTLITTGRDGAVRVWDLRSRSKAGEATASLERLGKQSLSALAANAGTNVIVAGTELWEREGPGDAPIFAWDARNLSAPHHIYTESHTDTVTDLRFHPQQENVLLTASTDGLVNLINVAEPDEDEAVLQVYNHKSALHHAGFLGDGLVYGLGTDETLALYHIEDADEDTPARQPIKLGDLREVLGMEYIVDIFVEDGAAPFVVGGKHSAQTLDFVPLVQSGEGWAPNVGERMSMEGAHGDEIVRDVYVSQETVYTSGEDGLIKSWRNAGVKATGSGDGDQTKVKREKKSKGKEGRYAPY